MVTRSTQLRARVHYCARGAVTPRRVVSSWRNHSAKPAKCGGEATSFSSRDLRTWPQGSRTCVICASQPPSCVRLHPGNQSRPPLLRGTWPTEPAQPTEAAFYRRKINLDRGTRSGWHSRLRWKKEIRMSGLGMVERIAMFLLGPRSVSI